tara:strand:+ start:3686 stop:6064 length:2379 start_codon:yes stop_codon:yes gene_type:complete
MKSNLIIFSVTFLFLCNLTFAETFKFNTKNIEIFEDKKQFIAGKGKATSSDGNIEINADEFDYQEKLGLLKSNGNGKAIIKSENLIITFDQLIYNQLNEKIEASGNVEILQVKKKIIIQTKKFFYNLKKNLIYSDTQSTLTDNYNNVFNVDNFKFEINNDLLKLKNLEFKDKDNNILKTNLAFVNTNSGKLFGKDVSLDFNKLSFNSENEPRLKAKSAVIQNNKSELTKGIFTTCKRNDNCPPWEISAKKIQHDKSKKTISYENALLKVYDFPVMYFPKFFHPDPTVDRQSGFLMPSIKNSNDTDNYLNAPYFFVIASNKDATFNPRFYPKEKFLLQTEYRQENSKSSHITDFSLLSEKNKNNKNHFFYNYNKKINNNKYENNINLKIEQTSNDTYLKSNNLKSEIINDTNILENSIGLDIYSDNLSINVNANIYEDLSKDNSDRYEYILPNISLYKNLENRTNLNGNFILKSQASMKNYNTNIYEKTNINDLIFRSYPSITAGGFYNDFEFLIKNSNSDNKNYKYKNNENIYLSSMFQYNSSLPLIKENFDYRRILKPKVSLRLAPSHTEDKRDEETTMNINNIYDLGRMSDRTIEGGLSITYGGDYSIFDNKRSSEIFNLKLANNIRLKENNDLPNINQMNEKTSNIFSEISFSPNKFFTTRLNNSIKNNLNDVTYENLITEFRINNFVTKFDYFNENNTNLEKSYLANETTLSINKTNDLTFATRKNKTKDLTEYYKFIYQYKNDCLAASIEYNKNYYSDRELKPSKNLLFKLSIIPFGEASTPNIKNK